MALIEFKNVNKYYGDYHALRDINLEIEKGQVVVILGPSGSGKSTLIRTINALEPIDEGTLTVSYTHLDVYKRQSRGCSPRINTLTKNVTKAIAIIR